LKRELSVHARAADEGRDSCTDRVVARIGGHEAWLTAATGDTLQKELR
jgi:hypothetical protein